MTVITLPTNLPLGDGCGFGLRRYDMQATSEPTGAQQDRPLGPPRWALSLVQPRALSLRDAGRWEALQAQLRGRINRLYAWDPVRKAPQGTLRGTLTLTSTLAAGATSMAVSGSTGTVLAGDLLQIGTGLGTSQLVKVVADGTQAAITFEPPLRLGYSSGTTVIWDKPGAYFALQASAASWTYTGARVAQGHSMDLLEVWS